MGNSPQKLFQGVEVADFPHSIETPHYKVEQKRKEDMTPFERVRHVFSTDEFGEPMPEFLRCKDTTLFAFIGTGIFGGVGRSRIAYMDFYKSNAHVAFDSSFDFRRKLQDKVFLGFGSGFWKVSWRAAAFTAMFTLSSTCIAAYRGKSAILDQVGGGACAGLLYKLREGPKSMVAGVIVGSTLGFTTGILTILMTRMTGLNIDDFIQLQHKERQANRIAIMEAERFAETNQGKTTLEELYKQLSDSDVKDGANNSSNSLPPENVIESNTRIVN